jgi:tetratricopeptide (TPR) repeat protein
MRAREKLLTFLDRWAGPLLGLLALVVYLATLSVGAFPGESARHVAEAAGVTPRLTPDQPLWHAAASVLDRIPLGGIALRLNLLNAFLAAAVVALLHGIMRSVVLKCIEVNPVNRSRAEAAARLAAVGAALFLAFCLPFWFTATRAHPVMLSALLLVLLARRFVDYAGDGRPGRLFLFAFLYGLATVESASFILFAPVFGMGLIYLLWTRKQLRPGRIVGLALSALAGLLLYVLASWHFYGGEGYVIREYKGLYQVLFFMWRDQWLMIKRSLPPVGWLMVVAVSIVPWLTTLLVARRALNEEKDWGYYLLHLVLTGILLGVLWNAPFAPWAMLGQGRLLVIPYVLCAAVFGYLCAYAFLLPWAWWEHSESASRQKLRRRLGPALAGILLLAALIAPFRNGPEANGRAARFIDVFARELVDSLDGRTWVVTDGSIDNHIQLAAREMGLNLTLLNLGKEGNESYMRYVSNLFGDTARLKNAAQVGLLSLLQEWMASDPAIAQKLALMVFPDLWLGAELSAVPVNAVFLGAPALAGLDVTAMDSRHDRFCNRLLPLLTGSDAPPERSHTRRLLALYRKHLARHLSLTANNLGVVLEDIERPDEAFAAYERSRAFDTDNVSALLNEAAMLDHGFVTSRDASIRADLNALIDDETRRYRVWALSRYYGFVRAPQAFVQMGLAWARSGQPGLAVSGLRRAMEFLPEEGKGAVKQMLADVYLLQDEDDAGETLYYELLVEDPANVRALLGSARIASRKGDFAKAKEFLERAETAGAPKTTMAMEWASAHAMAGQVDQTRVILEDLLEVDPKSQRGWAMLAGILVESKDGPGVQRCIDRLESLDAPPGLTDVMRGKLAEMEGDVDAARGFYENSLRARPMNRQVLEFLLRLDLVEGKQDDAQQHARRVLQIDPNNAFANYVMGAVHIAEGHYDLAEASLRRSLEAKLAPGAFNDLAWVVLERGHPGKAEKYARAALKMAPEMYQAWDTLGMALLKLARLPEAEEALEKALALAPDDADVAVHMAELRAVQGDKARAKELVDSLAARERDLSESEQNRLERVREMIKE